MNFSFYYYIGFHLYLITQSIFHIHNELILPIATFRFINFHNHLQLNLSDHLQKHVTSQFTVFEDRNFIKEVEFETSVNCKVNERLGSEFLPILVITLSLYFCAAILVLYLSLKLSNAIVWATSFICCWGCDIYYVRIVLIYSAIVIDSDTIADTSLTSGFQSSSNLSGRDMLFLGKHALVNRSSENCQILDYFLTLELNKRIFSFVC